mgnify:CR=1 FL=1
MARDRFYGTFKISLYLIALSRYLILLLCTSSIVYLMGKALKIQDLTFGDALMKEAQFELTESDETV